MTDHTSRTLAATTPRPRRRPDLVTAMVTAVATLAALAGTGCTADQHEAHTTFPHNGSNLAITNPNPNMPVTVTGATARDVHDVTVTVSTSTAGRSARTPAWTLTGDALDLGTPCGGSYVGLCEGSYTVTVPLGTHVTVNGEPVTVG